jgi:hypothetical protein
MTTNLFKIISKVTQIESPEDDLYEILPRFVDEEFVYDYIKGLLHKPIQRAFQWRGELCQLIIIPGSVEDEDGQHRHYFPGLQEEQVETALIELAAQYKNSYFEREKQFAFTSKQLQTHLAAGDIHLSQKQILRSILILSSADFTICRQDYRLMFKLIDTLSYLEEESDTQFMVYLGDLLAEEINKFKLNKA